MRHAFRRAGRLRLGAGRAGILSRGTRRYGEQDRAQEPHVGGKHQALEQHDESRCHPSRASAARRAAAGDGERFDGFVIECDGHGRQRRQRRFARARQGKAGPGVSLVWPVQGTVIHTSDGKNSKGIDIANEAGTPVIAAAGSVVYACNGLRGTATC